VETIRKHRVTISEQIKMITQMDKGGGGEFMGVHYECSICWK